MLRKLYATTQEDIVEYNNQLKEKLKEKKILFSWENFLLDAYEELNFNLRSCIGARLFCNMSFLSAFFKFHMENATLKKIPQCT